MDIFAGSEPREFISFRLGKESNGQPTRTESESNSNGETSMIPNPPAAEETHGLEAQETTVTSPTMPSLGPLRLLTSGIEIIEETSSHASLEQDSKGTDSPESSIQADPKSQLPGSPDYSPSLINLLATDASSSEESVQAYFARKMMSLGDETFTQGAPSETNSLLKASESGKLCVTPGLNVLSDFTDQELPNPIVTFLEPPLTASSPAGDKANQEISKRPRMESSSNFGVLPVPKAGLCDLPSTSTGITQFGPGAKRSNTAACLTSTYSESELGQEIDVESPTNPGGSAISQAMNPKRHAVPLGSGDSDSAFAPVVTQGTNHSSLLKTSGRALIKEYFANAELSSLPRGHPVIAFTEDQISSVLKVVAEETVRTAHGALEDLIKKASELNLGPGALQTLTSTKPRGLGKRRSRSATPGRFRDTSGAIQSDDDFSSIGYSFEAPSHDGIAPPPQRASTKRTSYSPVDSGSPTLEYCADSPGGQTLASLKAEGMQERSKRTTSKRGRQATSFASQGARRKVTRSCKIMKEAYFKGMEWTRTFVSGPVDPRWNKYKFYCQICKANISIYGKGAREILRHHSTEKHLRKDQRWRYEYLYKIDPITKNKIHQVRGKDGKVLTPYQLELELPNFIDVELIEIGQKLPFYDEYMSGMDYMASSSDSRARIQLSVLGRFLPSYGDREVLKLFWSDVGVIVNHQALFTDFNWSKERLTVSKLLLFLRSSLLCFPRWYPVVTVFVFLFQVLFHHMFHEIICDIASQVNSNGEYSIEFANDGAFVLIFIRYWRDSELCWVFLKRTGS